MSWSWAWWVFVPVLISCIILDHALRGHFNHAEVPRLESEAQRQADRSAAFVAALINGALWSAALTAVLGFFV